MLNCSWTQMKDIASYKEIFFKGKFGKIILSCDFAQFFNSNFSLFVHKFMPFLLTRPKLRSLEKNFFNNDLQ